MPTVVPTDPLMYQLHELVAVYGQTIKELVHEEFGDGVMSAIDFRMDLSPSWSTRPEPAWIPSPHTP
jgi:cyanate lyase